MSFERARQVADAVLYEGYVLYPYRASARKNQIRWQFGVLAPRAWCEAGGCESWSMQTECLVEREMGAQPKVAGRVRFLQVLQRSVERAVDPLGAAFLRVEEMEVDGRLSTAWDEGVEREVDFELAEPLYAGRCDERIIPFEFPGGQQLEAIPGSSGTLAGRFVRERRPIAGLLRVTVLPLGAPDRLVKIQVAIENVTPSAAEAASREEALRSSFVGVHTLLSVERGKFVSLLDPPEWASLAVKSCSNVRTWPVLIGTQGEQNILLSSPIILYDYPAIAAESPGDFYDGTEIDEILTLRTLALTDDEKREARATDERAAAIIDRVDAMPPEMFEKLHGALRHAREAPPWWDPASDASVSPETDSIEIKGVAISKGSRVRLCPGQRRTDAQDMFLSNRIATVQGVFFDVDNKNYLAVSLQDDPNAELFQSHARYLYFYPDEVEPLDHCP
jgi:hypothetical protein